MRMWLVNPRCLCRKHLLGEHVELHMTIGCINKGTSIRGYIEKGLLETHKILERHEELVIEMNRRGYKHNSPCKEFECPPPEGFVDIEANYKELKNRCKECCSLINSYEETLNENKNDY